MNHKQLLEKTIKEASVSGSEKGWNMTLMLSIANSLASIADDLSAKSEGKNIEKAIPIEDIEKGYESILDVAEKGYVDIEEVKVHFCKWLGIEDK